MDRAHCSPAATVTESTARRGEGKTKGEQLRDRDATFGKESQVNPEEED